MKPVALYDELGTLHGYACGRCRELGGHGHRLSREPLSSPGEHQIRDSLRNARDCCTCRSCRARIRVTWGLQCQPCANFSAWVQAWGDIGLCVRLGLKSQVDYDRWLEEDDG